MLAIKKPRGARKGQSEVIGGLIVLTLIFAMIVPMLINTYSSTVSMSTQVKQSIQQEKTAFNEKIEIRPLDPNNEAYIRAGWIPGVFINNTGTVSVTLTKLFLVNKLNNSVFRVYDLRYARPGITPDFKVMLVDVDLVGGGHPPPPAGNPIVLQPGENMLIVFNQSILPFAPNLIVLVESAKGVIHPIISSSKAQTLYPGRPGQGGGAGGAGPGAWRGIFAPQSGFTLQGAHALIQSGIAYTWRPPIHVYVQAEECYYWWCHWTSDPADLPYSSSFIYDDPDYPGLYMVDVVSDTDQRRLYIGTPYGVYYAYLDNGYRVVLKGYVGTYDAGGGGYATYVNGYAYEVIVYDYWGRVVYHYGPYGTTYLGSRGITSSDFDGNGIDELTVYSYLNGPNYPPSTRTNPDTDGDGDRYHDANVWTYMVARDLSNVDYVKITVKINYYWTTSFYSGNCPTWKTRNLKIFSIVAWRYDNVTRSWVLYQHRDYYYRSDKPVQFQVTGVFPLDRHYTYRVGVLFYDNYRDWDEIDSDFSCYTDFTMALEHMIVEYGVLNPLFTESPPLYIVAIPDPSLISGIGERDFMNAYNLTDINEAKVRAQQLLLSKLEEELNYAGISGYSVITDTQKACDLLFGGLPPKYAVIVWLQGGNISIPDVLPCVSSDYTVFTRIRDYHWVWVWPMEVPFAGRLSFYNDRISLTSYGSYQANITDVGLQARIRAYAFYLFNTLSFTQLASISWSSLLIENGTFYQNTSSATPRYGTSAYWIYHSGWGGGEGTGAIVINPVHLDWDVSGDGVVVDTLVQQIVYSSLGAWHYVRFNS